MTVDPFLGEVRPFAITYVPRSWAECNGQLLPINQYTALFSLLGTNFGGDGKTNFGLPNLVGRAPMHAGRGPGLTGRTFGEVGGTDDVTLTADQMPSHTHGMQALGPANTNAPSTAAPAVAPTVLQYHAPTSPVALSAAAIAATGDGQAHDNMQPWTSIRYFIALQGIYPTRP